jgi:hypothetical protein
MSRDVMRALAQARPAELDPNAPVDPATRANELHRAMTARAEGRGSAVRRLVPARRRTRPILGGGLGLVGAAAAAALVISSMGGGQGGITPGPSGDNGAQELDVNSTRAVLLAAADKAEQAPATGKYWRVTQMYLLPIEVGPNARPYTVADARIVETWTSKTGAVWVGQRRAGAKPKTPKDEKAWRLDGSPTRWDRGAADTVSGGRVYIRTTPDKGMVSQPSKGGPLRVPIAGDEPSFADVQNLPTDPAALTRLAEQRATSEGVHDQRVEARTEQARRALAANQLVLLLTTTPVPPKVRAAAFRALADMPGIRSEGKARDGRGRPGVAFSLSIPDSTARTSIRLIIDPATSQVLSEEVVSGPAGKGKERTILYLGAAWTNETPRPPALP